MIKGRRGGGAKEKGCSDDKMTWTHSLLKETRNKFARDKDGLGPIKICPSMGTLPLMREDLERLPDVLTEPFDRRQEFHDEQLGVHVMASIHPVVILEHALGREPDVRALEEALTRPTGTLAPAFIHRQSDLYDFWQTGDLCIQSGTATTSAPADTIDSLLGRLRGELLGRVRPVVEKIIGRSLDANVLDYSAQCYGRHQYLLAHDDRLDSGRAAH